MMHETLIHPIRLAALKRTALMGTAAEPEFDRLTRLAAKLMGAPIALVTLVDERCQFFKSCVGLPETVPPTRETPHSHSFCKHVVATGQALIIEDARTHPLVSENPAIKDFGVVAYAGMPLITKEGAVLGSFCVVDSVPRAWTVDKLKLLRDLSYAVMTEIELRTETIMRKQAEEKLQPLITGVRALAARLESAGGEANVSAARELVELLAKS